VHRHRRPSDSYPSKAFRLRLRLLPAPFPIPTDSASGSDSDSGSDGAPRLTRPPRPSDRRCVEEFAPWLLGSLRAGLVAIDADGAVRFANAAAAAMLRLEGDAIPIGADCRGVFAGAPVVAEVLLAAAAGRSAPGRAELTLDGGARTVGFSAEPVRDERGAIRGALLLFRDLQPLERADEGERLRERLIALGEMAAGLAHEIRNPLASLGVLAGLLRRRVAPDGEERELVDELLAEVRKLETTVGAALDYVKPAAPASAPVDVVDALEAAVAQVRARLAFEGDLERRYEAPPPVVAGDVEQLRGVFANLVANAVEAVRAAGGPGRIALRVFRAEGAGDDRVLRIGAHGELPDAARPEAVVEVSDSGGGVAPELRERIFYPFFTTKESGAGVGLALAHKAVVSHGGRVEIDDTPGGGATFRVRLPLAGGRP
jgi:signal transduction histidine kinase